MKLRLKKKSMKKIAIERVTIIKQIIICSPEDNKKNIITFENNTIPDKNKNNLKLKLFEKDVEKKN